MHIAEFHFNVAILVALWQVRRVLGALNAEKGLEILFLGEIDLLVVVGHRRRGHYTFNGNAN